MAVDQSLLDYIKSQLEQVVPKDTIKTTLLNQGWSLSDVEQALAQAQNSSNYPTPSDQSSNFYPQINISLIQNPSRLYAIPVFGYLIKVIALIPLYFLILLLMVFLGFLVIGNTFVILFTGRFWQTAYEWELNFIRLSAKMQFYLFGLTNKYPGFSFDIKDNYSLDIVFPEHPSRLFAIPLLGVLIRLVLLIPFLIYSSVINYATAIAVFFSDLYVFILGKYPESTFELVRDSTRLQFSTSVYMLGLADKYPSFNISFNHKALKIIWIILATFAFLGNVVYSITHPLTSTRYQTPNYSTRTPNTYPSSSTGSLTQ